MSIRFPALLAFAGTLLAVACVGGGDPTNPTPAPNPNPNPNPTPGTLAVSLSSTSGSVVAGNQVTLSANITRGGSFTGVVSLTAEGAPGGVTASFSTNSLASGVTSASLTLQVGSGVAAGTYPITVRATGTGVTAATASYALTVTAAAVPDFSITAAPTSVTVAAGATASTTITIARSGGFTGPVTFSASGLPANVSLSFAPAPASGTSTVATVTAAASAVAGSYSITVTGTGTGVEPRSLSLPVTVQAAGATGNFSLGLPSGRTLRRGDQTIVQASVLRTGGFTGDVALSVSGLPNDVTATFAPTTVPGNASTSDLTLMVGAAAPLGPVTVTVTGTAAGVGARSATFQLTVLEAPSVTVSLTSSQVTVTQGQNSAAIGVNLTRAGATGNGAMSVEGLPAGVTATFNPNPTPGNQSELVLSVGAGAAPGTYPLVVVATTTNARGEAGLSLTVQASGGGGGGNVTWQFCEADRFPLWFAFQDGTSGAWTRVLPGANQTYSFTINSTVGAVAFVNRESGSNADVFVFQLSRAELQQVGLAECVNNPAVKTLNGTIAGLGIGQQASVGMGGGSTAGAITANGPFTLTDVNDGRVDLVAVRSALDLGTFSLTPDRLILRRDLDLPNNGTIPLLDFGAAESFAPASAPITVANAGGDQVVITNAFVTQGGGFTSTLFTSVTGGATRTMYGVPTARTQSGDLHQLSVIAVNGTTSQRGVFQYNRELAARTITFGPALTTPTVSSLGSAPYPRLRAAATFQAEYGQGVGVTYTQTSGGGRSWTVTASPAYFAGASAYQLDMPDLTPAGGFDLSWALVGGVSTTWSVSASKVEDAPIGPFVENFRLMQASRTGTTTP